MFTVAASLVLASSKDIEAKQFREIKLASAKSSEPKGSKHPNIQNGCWKFGTKNETQPSTGSWCLVQQSPMLRVGWETDQIVGKSGTTASYWTARFRPYAEVYVDFTTTLTLSKLIIIDLEGTIDKFMANVFQEFYLFSNGRLCLQTGAQVQSILMTLQTYLNFEQCYKTMVQSLCDWSQWTSASAKIFDTCTMSQNQQVTLVSWNPIQTDLAPTFVPKSTQYKIPSPTPPASGTDTCFGIKKAWLTKFPLFSLASEYLFQYFASVQEKP